VKLHWWYNWVLPLVCCYKQQTSSGWFYLVGDESGINHGSWGTHYSHWSFTLKWHHTVDSMNTPVVYTGISCRCYHIVGGPGYITKVVSCVIAVGASNLSHTGEYKQITNASSNFDFYIHRYHVCKQFCFCDRRPSVTEPFQKHIFWHIKTFCFLNTFLGFWFRCFFKMHIFYKILFLFHPIPYFIFDSDIFHVSDFLFSKQMSFLWRTIALRNTYQYCTL
jgi:hypothetical protein